MEPTDATIDILKKIQSSIAQLRDRMDSGFTELRARADAQGQQLQSQAQRLGAIERRIGELVEVASSLAQPPR